MFKKLRFNTRSVKKYFLYAIGEIFIIIIGIYVALEFDNHKVKNEKQKYILGIYKNIQDESVRSLRFASYFITFNSKRDSLATKILGNELKFDDYRSEEFYQDYLESVVHADFDENLLEELNKQVDYLDDSGNEIFKILVELKKHSSLVKWYTGEVTNIVEEHKNYRKNNHDWFFAIENDTSAYKKEFEYKSKDFRYKNFLSDFKNYEIVFQSSNFSYTQALSSKLLIYTTNKLRDKELKPIQIDSVLSANKLVKFDKIKIDSLVTVDDKNLFKNATFSHLLGNFTKDTIEIKSGNVQANMSVIPPYTYSILKVPYKTVITVLINGEIKNRYQSRLNSYLIYE